MGPENPMVGASRTPPDSHGFCGAKLENLFFTPQKMGKCIDIRVMRDALAQTTTRIGSAALPYLEQGKLDQLYSVGQGMPFGVSLIGHFHQTWNEIAENSRQQRANQVAFYSIIAGPHHGG